MAAPPGGKALRGRPPSLTRAAMQNLAPLGLTVTIAGLVGLGYCIVQGLRIRRAGLPPAEIHARLHRLLAVNLASVALAALGLAILVAGLMF